MLFKKLAVVGGGQMGRALVGGLIGSGVVQESDVSLVEPCEQSRAWWREGYPSVHHVDLATAISTSDATLLAVKPNVMPKVAAQAKSIASGKLFVSIAAGVSLETLEQWLGPARLVRVMPNTPSLVGQGVSAYCCNAIVTAEDREWTQQMLECVGMAIEIDESQMDGVTGLSGSGPAYVCLMIEALADGGVLAGLPRPMAMRLATQTVLGTAQMVAQTQRHPGELKDAVASPGGTTIAGIAALEQNGLRSALIQAVAASAQRSRQMGGLD